MERTRELSRVVAMSLAGALTGALLIPMLGRPAGAGAAVRQAAAAAAICHFTSHPALAARISGSIQAARLRAMITRSDNAAASAVWAELGHGYLR